MSESAAYCLFFSVGWFGVGVWLVLGFVWLKVVEALEGIDDIVHHGEVDAAFVVVPI